MTSTHESIVAFRATLARCGVPVRDFCVVGTDGQTTPVGVEIVHGFLLTVEGRRYDVVTLDPWLPEADARVLNERPCSVVGDHNSGTSGTLGAVARAYGNGGGTPTVDIRGGVDEWHCDRPQATCDLVWALRKTLAMLDADEVRRQQRAWKTNEVATEFERYTDLSPFMRATLREGLETMKGINRDDPRVVALIEGWER